MYEMVTSPPLVGSARETETLDFKHRLRMLEDRSVDHVDIATSVAAFANRSGGNLLYGASQKADGPLAGFAPLSTAEVNSTRDACDNAIKSRCVPGPQWSSTTIEQGAGSLLAIHIEPHPSAFVAVRVGGDKGKGYGGEAYVFPLRVGTHTNYLTADQLPMHMDPKVRRTLLILSRINRGEAVVLVPRDGGRFFPDSFIGVDENLNIVRLQGRQIPIDLIESVWCVAPTKWYIALPFLVGSN